MWVLGGYWWVPGIAPSQPTRPLHTPGTPPPRPTSSVHLGTAVHGVADALNMVVGLISVEQLTLSSHFSVLRGITEVYNLVGIDNR